MTSHLPATCSRRVDRALPTLQGWLQELAYGERRRKTLKGIKQWVLRDLAKHVGHVVVAKMQGADAGMDRLKAVAGELTGVTVNWASEYGLLFRGGDRLELLAGDTVTINSKTYTLL